MGLFSFYCTDHFELVNCQKYYMEISISDLSLLDSYLYSSLSSLTYYVIFMF